MILQKRLLMSSLAILLSGTGLQPVSAAPWVRGFVVGNYGYAFRYGGRSGYSRGSEIEPGVDCVHGSDPKFANPDQTRRALAFQPWRSKEELDLIANPPGVEQTSEPGEVRFSIWNRAIAYRGYKHGIETYVNPFAADDPGLSEVNDRIGEGFNLDGKTTDRDFVSPDGEKGIDNALYRAWGCDTPWRGNGNANLDLRANDKMQNGLYTMVIRISGNQDPLNDSDATIEIGYSPDKIVKDARGGVAVDYSYRILTGPQYTRMKAKIKNGVVDSEQVAELHAPRFAWFYDQLGDADFHQGRLRLNIAADGSATGLLGGYRNWLDLYAENTFSQDGGQQGVREHEDHVALYFALKRNADAMPDPKTGQNMAISTAYRLKLAPVYVVDPAKPMAIPTVASDERRKKIFETVRAAMIKSTLTRIPQDVPQGTGEAAVPGLERRIVDLPSKAYFLKTLDRPHYPGPDIDNNGKPVDAEGNPLPASRPQQQADNASAGVRQP
jgi:hypothetical protein